MHKVANSKRISIHAPYAGSDDITGLSFSELKISIHAPYAGSDPSQFNSFSVWYRFQSTLPMQGATNGLCKLFSGCNFNPRSLCRERHGIFLDSDIQGNFNPRSLCRERQARHLKLLHLQQFQSTLPMQGATRIATYTFSR